MVQQQAGLGREQDGHTAHDENDILLHHNIHHYQIENDNVFP